MTHQLRYKNSSNKAVLRSRKSQPRKGPSHIPTHRKGQIEQRFADCGDYVTPLESALEPPAHVAEFELEG